MEELSDVLNKMNENTIFKFEVVQKIEYEQVTDINGSQIGLKEISSQTVIKAEDTGENTPTIGKMRSPDEYYIYKFLHNIRITKWTWKHTEKFIRLKNIKSIEQLAESIIKKLHASEEVRTVF